MARAWLGARIRGRASIATRAALCGALALSLVACADDDDRDTYLVPDAAVVDGGAPRGDAGGEADLDAGGDASANPAQLKACLDAPSKLATPPTGALPCELLPPGFGG